MMLLNQVLRYRAAVALIERMSGTRLLEVGSGSRGVAELVSARWQITACDRDFGDYGARFASSGGRARRVLGDATALPFPDHSFDVVVSLDMLEHVPPRQRERVLTELARVAGRRVVVGCPCGEPALAADSRIAAWTRTRLRREPPPWMSEHFANGFPEGEELRDALAPFGRVTLTPNVAIPAHERLGRLESTPLAWTLSAAAATALRPAVGRRGGLAKTILDALAGGDAAPTYRMLAVLDVT